MVTGKGLRDSETTLARRNDNGFGSLVVKSASLRYKMNRLPCLAGGTRSLQNFALLGRATWLAAALQIDPVHYREPGQHVKLVWAIQPRGEQVDEYRTPRTPPPEGYEYYNIYIVFLYLTTGTLYSLVIDYRDAGEGQCKVQILCLILGIFFRMPPTPILSKYYSRIIKVALISRYSREIWWSS
jgi:hypothetical protein